LKLKIEAAVSSDTLIHFYFVAHHHIPRAGVLFFKVYYVTRVHPKSVTYSQLTVLLILPIKKIVVNWVN